MVILGLGSNIGDRLFYLRSALTHIKNIAGVSVTAVSPIYVSDALLPDDAEAEWDHPYLNLALRCETSLTPHELLQQTKNIEILIGRMPGKDWGPRTIDIDILAWDDLVQYDEKLHVPHEHLHTRPFALWPLSDVAPRWVYPLKNEFYGKTAQEIAAQWGSRFSGDAPLHTRQIAQRIDTPQLMGILNITPDSFSDGGYFTDVAMVIEQAHQLVAAGAEILDIGAEATNPNAHPITAAEEWRRLEEVLTAVCKETDKMVVPPKISIDTRHPATAQQALALGVDWINDVGGLTDPMMREIIAASSCDVVMMHQLGIPARVKQVLPLHEDPVKIIYQWAQQQFSELEKSGINKERVIFDVGIGFGKTATQSLEILQRFEEFKSLNIRLLVGHSRKSFQTIFTDKPAAQRDIETLPISLYLAKLETDYLRVHNVEDNARAIKVAKAL
jgi:2-amino-4-hydroxy-6-hydroxymethyldihydropteridine diphosphokinase / dihydropteroate synthase